MINSTKNQSAPICFGWDRPTDERSLKAFLKKISRDEFISVLAPRLSDQEITAIIDHFSNLLRKHLSEKEYHQLFLSEKQ